MIGSLRCAPYGRFGRDDGGGVDGSPSGGWAGGDVGAIPASVVT